MCSSTEIQKLLDGLDKVSSSSQPLVLSQQNIAAFDIEDVRFIRHRGPSKDQTEVAQFAKEGYEILVVLVTRDDSINYGSSGASAVVHEMATVLVKRKQQ